MHINIHDGLVYNHSNMFRHYCAVVREFLLYVLQVAKI